MELLTRDHKKLIGKVQSPRRVVINRIDIMKYAIATEQKQKKYLEGDEAPLMFIFNLFNPLVSLDALGQDGLNASEYLELNFPLKKVMAGGTKINFFKSIYPGDELIGVSKIKNLYEKKGKSGPLIFLIKQVTVNNQANHDVYNETQTIIYR